MGANGSNPIRLTNHPAVDFSPSWSPDGKQVIFNSNRESRYSIYIMDSDGTGQKKLTKSSYQDFRAIYSNDGKKIIFDSYRKGIHKSHQIYLLDALTLSEKRLSFNDFYEANPRWSPDGSQIVLYSATEVRGNYKGDIYTMDSGGTNRKRLTSSENNLYPTWSPDGRRIAFTSERDGNKEIYIMNADGSNPVNLTRHPAKEDTPCWSPDGRKIIFRSNRTGNWEIFMVII